VLTYWHQIAWCACIILKLVSLSKFILPLSPRLLQMLEMRVSEARRNIKLRTVCSPFLIVLISLFLTYGGVKGLRDSEVAYLSHWYNMARIEISQKN